MKLLKYLIKKLRKITKVLIFLDKEISETKRMFKEIYSEAMAKHHLRMWLLKNDKNVWEY